MVALVSFCFLSLGLTAAHLLPNIKERASAELSGLEDFSLSTADTDIASEDSTNTTSPFIKCFEEGDRRADPLTVEDCNTALELLIREPRFREPQKWSHFPPQPGSRMVPDAWPVMGQGGNCVVILDCERSFRGVESFSIFDVANQARRVIDECPKRRTEKSHLGGIGLVAGSLKFYVAVNGRRRRGQDSAMEGHIPSVELAPSTIGAAATKTSTPPATNVRRVRCFEPTVQEVVPISPHDCQISHEMMLHEPHYVEQQQWSHFPPRPNTRPVPAHWPYGNCDVILTCHNNQAVDTFSLLDVGLAVKAILDECPPRRKVEPLGGVADIGHGRTFYVVVNGRGRAQQNSSLQVDFPSLTGNETIA